jgi:carbamoyl-phosphate synthase large subunit
MYAKLRKHPQAIALKLAEEGAAVELFGGSESLGGRSANRGQCAQACRLPYDLVCDGKDVVIGGIMEHVEEAGVHSGDSAMVMPPYKVSAYHLAIVRDETERIGLALGVKGLMNVQFALKDEVVYVLEVNPRSSRTVPFISKATGVPLARIAAQVAAGKTLVELGPAVRIFSQSEALSSTFIADR